MADSEGALIAVLFLLPALQAMLQRRNEKNHAKRVWLAKLHLLLNVSAGVFVAAAGVAVFVANSNIGGEHLTTPHSWAALVTGMFFTLNVFQGVLLTFEGTKANWQWKDETHVLTGVLIYIGGVVTMLYGLQTTPGGAGHNLIRTMVKKLELLVLGGLLGAPCATILSRCAAAPSLFAVHPAANAVAFLLCFPLGIYVMLERKSVTDFKTRVFLSKLHMVFQVLAMLLLSAGGAAAFMTKNAYGKDHFTSTHSWLAGATATLSTLNMLGGLATTFGGKKTSWQWNNPGHRIGGTLAFLGGGCSVILGVYSGSWGISQLGEDLLFKVASSVAAAYSLLFLKLVLSSSASPAKKND
ncbi:Cytochrome b561/ferric reductase transmembrane [Phytophthora cactorum]|nr:Cytochrome b561/ferric reductase transmembrane [Phytophthora cactorum]